MKQKKPPKNKTKKIEIRNELYCLKNSTVLAKSPSGSKTCVGFFFFFFKPKLKKEKSR